MFFTKKPKNKDRDLLELIDIPVLVVSAYPYTVIEYNFALERIFPLNYNLEQNFLKEHNSLIFYFERIKKEKEIKTYFTLKIQDKDQTKELNTFLHLTYDSKNSHIICFFYLLENYKTSLYEILANQTPIGIAVHQDQKVVYMNPYGLKLLNYETEKEVYKKDIFEFIEDNYKDTVKKRIGNIYAKDLKALPLHEVFITKDKKKIHVEVQAKKILWNHTPSVLVIFKDITENVHKKNFSESLVSFFEKILKEKNIRISIKDLLKTFQNIIQGNLVCIWFSDFLNIENMKEVGEHEKRTIYIESTLEKDIHETYIKDLLYTKNSPLYNCIISKKPIFIKNFIQEISDLEFREAFMQNKIHHYWCMPLLSSEGNIIGILINYYGFDENLKQFSVEYLFQLSFLCALLLEREKIEKENFWLSEITRDSYDGLILMDPELKILWYNQKILEFFPIIKDKIKTNVEISLILRSILSDTTYERIFKKIFLKEPFKEEFQLVDSNNKKAFFLVLFKELKNTQNLISGFYLTFRDITREMEYEQKLIEAKSIAEQNAKAKSQFLAIMSHEIRTPLNVIVGIIEYLSKNNTDKAIEEDLNLLKTSSEHLLNIVNNILDYSKIEYNKLEIQNQLFSLELFLEKLVNICKLQAKQKNIIFESSIDPNLPKSIYGDKIRLNQILLNLLSNSFKFTEQGKKIQLIVTKKEVKFDKAIIDFCIKDEGIGIPNTMLNKIFEPFTQLDSDPSRKSYGTGLGLAITKKIVELLQGEIFIESEIHKGTKINIILPFKMSDDAIAVEEKKTVRENLSFAKLLIVDDYEPNLLITKKFLELWNIQCDTCTSGEEAIHKVKGNSYSMILLDLHMPGMDGYTTAQKIREFNKEIPIIAVTATTIEEYNAKIQKDEINDIIIKPFKPEELIKIIKKFINT